MNHRNCKTKCELKLLLSRNRLVWKLRKCIYKSNVVLVSLNKMELATCGILTASAFAYLTVPKKHPTTAPEEKAVVPVSTDDVDLKKIVAIRLQKAQDDIIVVGDELKEATSKMELLKRRHEQELEFETLELERISQKRQKLEATRATLIQQRDALSTVPDLPVDPAAAAEAAKKVPASSRKSTRTAPVR